MPTQYWCALAHERFQPDDLLKQAEEAEQAGFDGICCSDHLAPWWTDTTAPTSSGNAWVWLGAANATTRAKLGPAVTAIVHRYNPVVVAQQVATLEMLAPAAHFSGSARARRSRPRTSRRSRRRGSGSGRSSTSTTRTTSTSPSRSTGGGEDQVSDEMFAKDRVRRSALCAPCQ